MIHSEEEIEEYKRVHARPNGLCGGLGLYRSAVGKDVDDWNKIKGRKLIVPHLVLWGGKDPVLPTDYIQGIDSVAHQLEVHVHNDAGHFLQEEDPKWCAYYLLQYLKNLT